MINKKQTLISLFILVSTLGFAQHTITLEEVSFKDGRIWEYTGTATNIIIPDSLDGELVTGIGSNAFRNKNLTDVILPSGITIIDVHAFRKNKLTKIIIPPKVKTISLGAFAYNNLTEITIPSSVENIYRYAFIKNNISKVIILEGALKTINNVFLYNKLTEVTIPNSVEIIYNSAFIGNQLTEITIPSTIEVRENAFDSDVTIIRKEEIQISIYPNPSTHYITVQSLSDEIINIYSVTGTLIMSSESKTIDISELPTGVYLLKQGESSTRFIKE
ncbi:MAG: leucine-rich repeat protein [Cytophagales bacterium]|nr:leucine-rich repeat protein [Cytophagales bacterium]